MLSLMLRTTNHYLAQVDEIPPAPVPQEKGWRDMDIRFIATRELSGSGAVCLFRTVFPPGAAHEKHVHPNADEFIYVISGRAGAGCEGDEFEVGAGSVQIVPKGRVHWLRNLDPQMPVELVGGYLGVGSLEEAGYEFVGVV
jgi:quercetin dioxygenase-like cupin family protein